MLKEMVQSANPLLMYPFAQNFYIKAPPEYFLVYFGGHVMKQNPSSAKQTEIHFETWKNWSSKPFSFFFEMSHLFFFSAIFPRDT